MRGWWFEIGISVVGLLGMVGMIGGSYYSASRFETYNSYIEVLQEENAELLQKNADLEEQCVALTNNIEWWMGYAEGSSEGREAAFRECDKL